MTSEAALMNLSGYYIKASTLNNKYIIYLNLIVCFTEHASFFGAHGTLFGGQFEFVLLAGLFLRPSNSSYQEIEEMTPLIVLQRRFAMGEDQKEELTNI